jgi:phenylacetate-CoA ligase
MRIRGWLGRADQSTKVRGLFVTPSQIAEIASKHPELGRLRLIVGREGEQDTAVLEAECAEPSSELAASLRDTFRSVTRVRCEVVLVPPATLPKTAASSSKSVSRNGRSPRAGHHGFINPEALLF